VKYGPLGGFFISRAEPAALTFPSVRAGPATIEKNTTSRFGQLTEDVVILGQLFFFPATPTPTLAVAASSS
jgi:hypothetical protein